MQTTNRFGRRLSTPSLVQIRSELRAAVALDEGRLRHAREAGLPETASWDDIGTHLAKVEQRTAKPATKKAP